MSAWKIRRHTLFRGTTTDALDGWAHTVPGGDDEANALAHLGDESVRHHGECALLHNGSCVARAVRGVIQFERELPAPNRPDEQMALTRGAGGRLRRAASRRERRRGTAAAGRSTAVGGRVRGGG